MIASDLPIALIGVIVAVGSAFVGAGLVYCCYMMRRRNANREAMLLSDLKDHQSALALKDNSMNAKI